MSHLPCYHCGHITDQQGSWDTPTKILCCACSEDYRLNVQFTDIEIGTKVKLPFDETGTVIKINNKTLDWFPYKVRIRKAIVNKTNQILEFKKEHLQPE